MHTNNDSHRASQELRIMERIEALEPSELDGLEAWLDAQEGRPVRRGVTRREWLLSSGAALLGLSAGVGGYSVISGQHDPPPSAAALPTQPPRATSTAAAPAFPDLRERVAELEAQAGTLTDDLSLSNSLLDLYHQLEAVGLDDTIRAGMSAVLGVLATVGSGAATLRNGLRDAQGKLSELDQALSGLDDGLAAAEGVVTRLSGLVQVLENGLRAAGEPVRPLTDALGSFFRSVVERIPGVGASIIETIDRVEALVGAIPESIENINRDLLAPLRERLFPREGENVRVRLLEPLVGLIFQPADALLGRIAELETRYAESLQAPTEAKLQQRSELRQQIEKLQGEREPR